MPLKRVEVAVAMKQLKPILDTAGGNQDIHCSTGRNTQRSELTVVLCSLHGKVNATQGDLFKIPEQSPSFLEGFLIPEPLQDLSQYDVGHRNPVDFQVTFKPRCLGSGPIKEIFNPDTGINENHGRASWHPSRQPTHICHAISGFQFDF